MNLNRLFITCILVLSASATVHADGIPTDGMVVVGHGTDPGTSQGCGTTFVVPLNGSGGGVVNCFNDSGQAWSGLDIMAMIPASSIVNCTAHGFTCGRPVYTSVGNSSKNKRVEIMLTGGFIPSSPSDTTRSEFFIDLSPDSSGSGFFGVDGSPKGVAKVTAILIPTPEPSVAMLVLVGGLCVLCFSRRS